MVLYLSAALVEVVRELSQYVINILTHRFHQTVSAAPMLQV